MKCDMRTPSAWHQRARDNAAEMQRASSPGTGDLLLRNEQLHIHNLQDDDFLPSTSIYKHEIRVIRAS